jgi:CheY-like chemotaxis protein
MTDVQNIQYKILIADDKEKELDMLTGILQNPNYEFIKAHSGDEAHAKILQGGLNLIILDDTMPPGPAGSKIAEETRKKDPYTPIVLWSTELLTYTLRFKDKNITLIDKGNFGELKEYVNSKLPLI